MADQGGWTLQFPYRRSLGPVVGAFFTGLRDGKVLGAKTADGRVLCPPLEYDPDSGESVQEELVELSDTGVVQTAAWVTEPMRKHPVQRPFAWALIKIDGADTSMVHAVDAGSSDKVAPGTKVKVRWAAERKGHITDIECFEPI